MKNYQRQILTSSILSIIIIIQFCSKQPTQPEMGSGKGRVILTMSPANGPLSKEAKAEVLHHVTASIVNSSGSVIAGPQTKNVSGGSTIQFTFENLDPATGLKAILRAYDVSEIEKYKAESASFSITAGGTTEVSFGTWTLQSIEPEMCYVPAGPFQMGDNFNEGSSSERPVHTVYLSAYYIGRYEITNALYKKFIDDAGYTTQAYWVAGLFGQYTHLGNVPYYWINPTYRGGSILGNDNFPVTSVTWYEAMAYCKWLSAKTGKTYRLPTEAEWEKAARGTDQRRYPWGNNLDGSYANYYNSGDPYDNGFTPVGFYDGSMRGGFLTRSNASPYGAYDMTGNVLEWCSDWYGGSYYASSPASNPTGPLFGPSHVLRGGSRLDSANFIQSTARYFGLQFDYRDQALGFRCVREP